MLRHWNSRINLTAIRSEEEIVTRHFGESFFAARHLFPLYPVSSSVPSMVKDFDVAEAQSPQPEARVADLGSGAGFPGIPIKLWEPNIQLTLIESNRKKATFLREVTRVLTLTNVDVRNVRAETLPKSSFEVVTLRAVERLTTLLARSAALLTPGGRLALLISESQLKPVISEQINLRWDSPIPLPSSRNRIFLIGHANQEGKRGEGIAGRAV
jgi:16S rRNA (guanine527-N7)-methyltransferase